MKKFVSLLLAMVLALALCSFSVAEKPYRITVISNLYGENEPSPDDPQTKQIEEALNIELDVSWVSPGESTNKFTTVMSSTSQPMVYTVAGGTTINPNFIDMCMNDVFWDLTDYIQNNELFREKMTSPAALAACAINGRNYTFPLTQSSSVLGILYRTDWIEALNAKGYNLVEPTNIEEFKAMVEAFTKGDPDGNGVDDTIGFAYCDDADEELDFAGFNLLMSMTGGPVGWGFTEDDKLMPYYFFDEYFENLDLFKWMYDNGYMNTDFAINTDKHSPLANNYSGSMITSATNSCYTKYDNLNNIVGEGKWEIKAAQVFFTKDGKRVTSSTMNPGSLDAVVIPKYSVRTEEDLKKILDVFARLNEENSVPHKTLVLGVEGLHYDMVDGVYTQTEEQAQRKHDDTSDLWSSTFPHRIDTVYYGQKIEDKILTCQKLNAENEAYAVIDESMPYMTSEVRNQQLQIATIISDARVKYIVGRIDKDGFIAERDRWLAAGGQAVIDAVNAAYQASK